MKKKLTKEQQLVEDWKAYNKGCSNKKLKMSFDDYKRWVYGKVSKRRKDTQAEFTFGKPKWAVTNDHIASVVGHGKIELARRSMVEQVAQGIICGDEADEILVKAGRIALTTSKGCYQYISPDTDIKTLGKKTQQL
jgi:hypothetical protein